MAGSTGVVTITEQTHSHIRLIEFDWITGSSSQTGTATGYTVGKDYDGEIVEIVTSPDSTAIPTDNYDIVITDKNGLDILVGSAMDRDTTTTEYLVKATTATGRLNNPLGYISASSMVFSVTNAGTEKRGRVFLYLK